MAFQEDLSVFLAIDDFGVCVKSGSIEGVGILDMPSEIIADGVVLTTDFKLTCLTSQFGSLLHSDKITVDSVKYTVRSANLLDDGKFVELMLMKD
jgi:hypothetical protein